MLFSSYSFVIYFFPLCLLASLLLRRFSSLRYYILFLTAISLLFYSFGSIWYLFLILASIGFNYFIAGRIGRAEKPKALLFFAIALNLLLLTYFKYTNFFIETFSQLSGHEVLYSVVLPIGISFYTFQQIMYLVDTYRGKVEKHTFGMYALYISFFPQLVAGPIVCHSSFFPQFHGKTVFRNIPENLSVGLSFFAYGLFKKVVIADQLEAMFVDPVFNSSLSGDITFWEAWVGSVAYAFQIYYDFSGYSDMALGLGKCFGVELPQNFNSPYKSRSPREFWRRWHMTLSFFLRNYLYIPMGGNRVPAWRKNFNIIATMFLAGLWHGAGWGFMIWGVLHGLGVAVSHWIGDRKEKIKNIPVLGWDLTPWAVTFAFLCLCWVPFRGETMHSIYTMWSAMFSLSELFSVESSLYAERDVLILPILLLHCVFAPNLFQIFSGRLNYVDREELDQLPKTLESLAKWRPDFVWALAAGAAFYLSFLLLGKVNSFIYFQF